MLVEVARLIKAHGIKGDLLAQSLTDVPELRFAPKMKLQLADQTPLTVVKCSQHSGKLLLHFAEISDRTAAEQVAGNLVFAEVDPAELPPTSGKYFDRQLIGLLVATKEGDVIGKVIDLLHLPAQDVLVVNSHGKEVLIPFVDPIVPVVDLVQGVLTIDPPTGLLEVADEN